MGNFANTLFSMLLGWVQSAVAWLWRLIGAEGADGLMGWVLDNWLWLAVLLCALGLAVDFVVYLVRWQPYRVWRSFLTGGSAVPDETTPQEPQPEPMQWVYADGGTAPEIPPMPPEPAQPPQEPQRTVQRVIPARRRRTAEGNVEYVLPSAEGQPGYNRPYYPPQWQTEQHDGGTQE